MREPSPYPGFADSIRRGVFAAGSSTAVLTVSFLSLFAVWAAIVSMGAGDVLNPRSMANLLALPPLHLLFSDTQIAFLGLVGGSPALSLLAAVGLTLARAVIFGAIIALLGTRLGWVEPRPLRAWARAIPQLLLISFAFFGAGAAVPFLLLGFLGQLGTLAQLAGPVVALHFLAFAPVAAVLDGSGYRTAMWRSARAARLPGGSHLSLTFGYFAICLFLFSIVPAAAVTPATPSIRTWAVALVATVLHVGVQGAFVYRWLSVGHHIPERMPTRPGRGRSARPAWWPRSARSTD